MTPSDLTNAQLSALLGNWQAPVPLDVNQCPAYVAELERTMLLAAVNNRLTTGALTSADLQRAVA